MAADRRILFVINPAAGSGKAARYRRKIEESLAGLGVDYKIIQTKQKTEGTQVARAAAESGYDTVVAVGGDGTAREIAKGLYGTQVLLGLLTAGTGNDLARSLGYPKDYEQQLDMILQGNRREIDVGMAMEEELFLNVCSMGLDAYVVEVANRIKRFAPRFLAYWIGVLSAIFRYEQKRVRVEGEGFLYDGKVILVAVGNGSYYGGGFQILPDADMGDGLLDTIVGEHNSRIRLLGLLLDLLKGEHIRGENRVWRRRTQCTQIGFDGFQSLNVDGEVLSVQEPVIIRILEEKLGVIAKSAEEILER